jgi:hypothetical protein
MALSVSYEAIVILETKQVELFEWVDGKLGDKENKVIRE